MRSWPSAVLVLVLGCALGCALGCGNDHALDGNGDPACEMSHLTYQNFGEPFALDWCRGCHSAAVPPGMRQKAPININFDTRAELMQWQDRILMRATSEAPTMPPAGGPSADERALLAEWLECGGK